MEVQKYSSLLILSWVLSKRSWLLGAYRLLDPRSSLLNPGYVIDKGSWLSCIRSLVIPQFWVVGDSLKSRVLLSFLVLCLLLQVPGSWVIKGFWNLVLSNEYCFLNLQSKVLGLGHKPCVLIVCQTLGPLGVLSIFAYAL